MKVIFGKMRGWVGLRITGVGGLNPSEKYARQNGNLPQIGVKIKNI